jgi:hypothetical protein
MDEIAVPGVYIRSVPECPSSGTYTVGRLDEMPSCSIGGVITDSAAHVLP